MSFPKARPFGVRRQPVVLTKVLANFCNLTDAKGRVIYTPAMHGADDETFRDWMARQVAAGSTHVITGPFEGGKAYVSGDPAIDALWWDCPDLWSDLPQLRAYLERILAAGCTPVCFLDGGGPDPMARIRYRWPRLFLSVSDLIRLCVWVPAWEPVRGAWTSRELHDAIVLLDQLIGPEPIIAAHGSPGRWCGSSNPIEPDDPWHGHEAEFFLTRIGPRINLWLYQTEHGEAIYRDANEDDDADGNYLNRWQDGVYRLGLGKNGWRQMPICAMETGAYEFYRRQKTTDDVRGIATRLKRVADKWGVEVGWGNGLPL